MNKNLKVLSAILLLSLMAFAGPAHAELSAAEKCKRMEDMARNRSIQKEEEMKRAQAMSAKRAQEASSCLSRAGESIVRAAIPPSLGSILGVLMDPGGYMTNAMSNAACNVVTNESNKVARGASDVNGAIRKGGSDAQQVFTGQVDQSVGGKGNSGGVYNNTPPPTPDSGFFQTMSCRLFGRC